MINTILDSIGNTPLIRIDENIIAKAEFMNPSGSIKDRIALEMINNAKSTKISSQSFEIGQKDI